MKQISDYIGYYKNYFPDNFCDDVIKRFENANWESHTWQTNNQEAFSYNEKELSVYKLNDTIDKDISVILWQNIANCLGNYQFEKNLQVYTSNVSKIRLNRYTPGTMMRKHVDHIYDLFDGKQKGIPVLSIIINLNNDYEGGELVFFDNLKFSLQKGDVVIFPSNFIYPHSINEVKSGIRYSAVAWGY